MQRIGRARKRPFLFFWVEHLLLESIPAWRGKDALGKCGGVFRNLSNGESETRIA